MPESHQKAKIKWKSRRGMLELDLIFSRFNEKNLETLTEAQLADYNKLLDCPDPDLFAWFMGAETMDEPELYEIFNLIYHYNSFK